MPDIKDTISNKQYRIKNPSACNVINSAYSLSQKTAYIICAPRDCGKTNTVCYIAQELRNYYGKRQVTTVLNETLQKEILHVAMIDGDVNKCIGFSSKGDEPENTLNSALSLCLSYSKIIVIAVRYEKKGAKAGMVSDVSNLCQSFGYSVQNIPLSKLPVVPANGVHLSEANQVISGIKQIIP
ncbi:MAG: hypothetical protein IJ158_08640 [Treponema sp.]|nr:hypothetical protein [Treponema sp.]